MEPHFWHEHFEHFERSEHSEHSEHLARAPPPAAHDDLSAEACEYTMLLLPERKEIGVPASTAQDAVRFALRRVRADRFNTAADVFFRKARLCGCSRVWSE